MKVTLETTPIGGWPRAGHRPTAEVLRLLRSLRFSEAAVHIGPNSMDRGRLNIGNYCNNFDGDIHGPVRSHQAREQTRQSLAEAWSLLETLGYIAPETNQGNYGWFLRHATRPRSRLVA